MYTPYRRDELITLAHRNDEKNLDLLSVLHYVAGGFIALLSCAFIAQIVMGAMFMKGSAGDASARPSPAIGLTFIIAGSLAVVFGWTVAALIAFAGRFLARRRHHRFCIIVAAFSSLWIPFGTLLGVFTLLLLTKPHIRMLFGEGFVDAGEIPRVVAPEEHAGWTSPEAKARYMPRAVLIGIALVAAQLTLPLFFGVRSFLKAVRTPIPFAEMAGAAQFQNRIWFIQSSVQVGDKTSRRLASIGVDDGAAPLAGPDIPSGSRFLAAVGSGLWILGTESLARYEGGRVATYACANAPYWSTPPFFYDGAAILDWEGRSKIVLKRLDGDQWREAPGASWRTSVSLPKLPTAWSALPAGSGFDVFVQFKDDLRWRRVGAEDSLGDPRDWDLVEEPVNRWAAIQLGGESLVFLAKRSGLFDGEMQVMHSTGAGWTKMSSFRADVASSFAALPQGTGVRLVSSGPSGLTTLDWDGRKAQSRHLHHKTETETTISGLPWSGMLWLVGVAPSLVAAGLLTRLMRRYRVDSGDGADGPLRFASLFQRGLAHGIDQSVSWMVGVVYCWRWYSLGMVPGAGEAMNALGVMLISWLATLLVTSYMEGRWGLTPGKWIVGIRVTGNDVPYCGFWRALLRNLLRIVDGVLSFAVGIVVVAFTRKWQRLGDLAARTMVVRISVAGK